PLGKPTIRREIVVCRLVDGHVVKLLPGRARRPGRSSGRRFGRVGQTEVGADENPGVEPGGQEEIAARRIPRPVGALRLGGKPRSGEGETKCCRTGEETVSAVRLLGNADHPSPLDLPESASRANPSKSALGESGGRTEPTLHPIPREGG